MSRVSVGLFEGAGVRISSYASSRNPKKKYSCDLDVVMKKVQKITARAHFELQDFACSQQVEILFEAVHLFYRIVLEHLKHS